MAEPIEMKVTTKKSVGFYIKSAKSFFQGVEDKDGNKKDPVDTLSVSGLGDAINVAVAAATVVQAEGLAGITNIDTSYTEMEKGSCPRILITLTKGAPPLVVTESSAPVIDYPDDAECDKDKLKKVKKEGGKRGVEIEGAADMGGLEFFSTALEEPNGDVTLLLKSLEAMNAKPIPGEEERKGCSGHIGKAIFSAGDEQLAVVTYLPPGWKADTSKHQQTTTPEEWVKAIIANFGGEVQKCTASYGTAIIKKDDSKGVFPLKIRDPMILESNNFLRSKGLFPEDKDSDDDEYVFGDDDFPS